VKKKVVLGLLTLALAFLLTPSALAAPQPNLDMYVLDYVGASGELFEAEGAPVDASRVCASGTVDEISKRESGPPNGDFAKWNVLKRFNCDDESGTFDLRLLVTVDLNSYHMTGHWQIVEGTGNYSDLRGKGSFEGVPVYKGSVSNDHYTGTTN